MLVVMLAALALLYGLPPAGAVFTGTTSNPSNSVAAATRFCTGNGTALTPKWLTGFESGVATIAGGGLFDSVLVSAGGSPVQVVSSVARSGNYSLLLTDASTTGKASVGKFGVLSATSTARFALRFATLPTVDVSELMTFYSAGQTGHIGFDLASGKLKAAFTTGTAQTATSTVTAGVWYVVEAKIDLSGTTRTLDWRVDGVAQTQASLGGQTATVVNDVYLGGLNNTDKFTAYFDDMIVTTSGADYPIGDGHTQPLRPNVYNAANSSDTGNDLKDVTVAPAATANVGATSYQALYETPMTSTNDYIRQTTGNATDYWQEFGFDDITRTGCINGVSAVAAIHAAGATANTAKTSIFQNSGTNEQIVQSGNVASATLQYFANVITPYTGAWDATKLSAITARIGYRRTGGSTPYWDGLLIEYDQSDRAQSGYKNAVVADNPTAYWRLGDTTGPTAADTKGSYPGTYTNGPVLGATGAAGDANTAAYFDGTNDYVTAPYNATLNPAQFTIEAWAKVTAGAGNYRTVITSWNDAGGVSRGYWLGASTSNNWEAQIGVGGSLIYLDGGPVIYGVWTHLAATYESATSTLRLYVNGVEIDSNTGAYSANNAAAFGIGAGTYPSGLADHLPGGIDEVALYSTPLSASRIRTHYAARSPYQATILADAPTSYWHLDETTGATATDSTGGVNGTYTNSSTLGISGMVGDSGTAVNFNSSNKVTLGNVYGFPGTTSFSVETWVRTPATPLYAGIVGRSDFTSPNIYQGWAIEQWNDASISFLRVKGTSGEHANFTSKPNTWYHVIGVYDSANSTIKVYANGTLMDNQPASLSIVNASVPMYIGWAGDDSARFTGMIDEVAIYNGVALSPAQVLAHYNAGKP